VPNRAQCLRAAFGLWRETARGYLSGLGFVQSGNESFAQTMARALGISTQELRVCIAEGLIGSALLARFREPVIAIIRVNRT